MSICMKKKTERRLKICNVALYYLIIDYERSLKGEPRVEIYLSSPFALATSFVVSEVLQGFLKLLQVESDRCLQISNLIKFLLAFLC